MKIKLIACSTLATRGRECYLPDCPVSKALSVLPKGKVYVPTTILPVLLAGGCKIEYTGQQSAILDALGCEYKGERKSKK